MGPGNAGGQMWMRPRTATSMRIGIGMSGGVEGSAGLSMLSGARWAVCCAVRGKCSDRASRSTAVRLRRTRCLHPLWWWRSDGGRARGSMGVVRRLGRRRMMWIRGNRRRMLAVGCNRNSGLPVLRPRRVPGTVEPAWRGARGISSRTSSTNVNIPLAAVRRRWKRG